MRRIVSALYTGKAADNVMMINTYQDESYLTVISGRRLLFNQSVPFGETMLLNNIASELDITTESAHALIIDHGLGRKHQALASGSDVDADI